MQPLFPVRFNEFPVFFPSVLTVAVGQDPSQSHGCAHGSCYPATGDLLVGREKNLKASSTCGMRRKEPYCIVSHLQDEKKCFDCDSRRPYNPLYNTISHRIENVITTFKPHRKKSWWQSENGKSDVFIQLDLEAEFHFTHLIMTFKTFRPAAMLIERSADFGRTWQIYRYFAHDCAAVFPGVSEGPLRNINDIICESRYSDIEPSTEGEVIYRVLDPAIRIQDPYSPTIQNQLKITNLRVNFTKLHTLGDNLLDPRDEIKEKYYYAIYELVVRGNCFCYGHASECAPIAGIEDDVEGMVHGRCVCNHNTKGLNCEQCDDFYNDHPWRPAEGRNTNACKKCNCNSHSTACHFDMAVYLATGNVSGGVCDDCQHNTMGHHCETCKPFYYKDPVKDIRDPRVCIPCDCDPDGSQNGGMCDSHTDPSLGMVAGQCRCKTNVEGPRCDRCKTGFFGLSTDNPHGCQPCQCDPRGTVSGSSQCDPVSGDCFCKRLVTGRSCDQCLVRRHKRTDCFRFSATMGRVIRRNLYKHVFRVYVLRAVWWRSGSISLADPPCGQVLGFPGYLKVEHWSSVLVTFPTPWNMICSSAMRRRYMRLFMYRVMYHHKMKGVRKYMLTMHNVSMQMPRDWEEVQVTVIRPGPIPTSSPCGNTIPDDDRLIVSLPAAARFMVPPQPVCLERDVTYTLLSSMEQPTPSSSWTLRQTYERYRCHDGAKSVTRPLMSDTCAKLISSMSAIINDGALPCNCDPQGSISSLCDVRGGQCRCRPNVMGRRCHQCAPGMYGFGPSGCTACGCSLEGSVTRLCDKFTGQCQCRPGAFGQRCDRCQSGYWGFPSCRPCQCNGHADQCDQRTGACISCRDNTGGDKCERCANGYYGNPILGTASGSQCRPCPCPDGPNSGRHFAVSCYQDSHNRQIICNCNQGYTGARCEECAPGYYGNPSQAGGRCQPCQCNNNIDMSDVNACDSQTGQCNKCLYNTEGPNCGICKSGFFGDASRRNCRKCTCNFLGTERSQCIEREDCVCQRATGQCQCLQNVVGLACDHCAPNHWNLASGRGCEPCSCDPNNSVTSGCNEFSGQCQCRDGFGGKTCTDCQENFWGNPRTQCRACDCDWRGIETSQCNRVTGHCVCQQGVSGVRCDQCARGFSGQFPNCQPCHQCFGDWDRIVQDLAARTKGLAERAHGIQTTGLIGPYEKAFKDLEDKLAQAQDIVTARNATATAVTTLMELIEDLRAQIGETTDTLNSLEGELTIVQDSNSEASKELSALEREARELNLTSEQLHHQLDILKNSNFLGAYDSILGSYNRSRDAERRANESTTTKPSTVSQSADTRRRTERLIAAKKDDFNRKNAANKRALGELNTKTQGLEMKKLNEKVCGTPGDAPCAESPCGGAGCRDDEGKRHCGGLNCNGAVAVADNALERARHAERELNKAMKEVEGLFTKVAEAKTQAEEAKGKAKAALDKAATTKNKVERSNNDLRDLIKQIRDFLTEEGADPDSIEAVANRVLELSIPASPIQIKHLADEIKERVHSLSNVDAILQQTQNDVRKAEQLLLDAKRARHHAEGVKTTAETVEQALVDAKNAQTSAEKAIRKAKADIGETKKRLTEVKTSDGEMNLNDAVARLNTLRREINALKTKRASNSMAVARAEETATMARDKANEAKQILDGQLTDKYNEVQQRVDTKAKAVQDAKKRAERLRDEAKELLKDAQKKLQRLAELEKNYEENQKKLEGKARQLDGLEDKMKSILHDINKQIQIYNTCQ
uniref:Laminin, beta 2 (laminin S) n=1 Tax=Oreochromis niloticus TaxID=8128 RepID=A0A669EIH6_ORENI